MVEMRLLGTLLVVVKVVLMEVVVCDAHHSLPMVSLMLLAALADPQNVALVALGAASILNRVNMTSTRLMTIRRTKASASAGSLAL